MKYYGFDDVRVIPIASTVNSRDDVDTSVRLADFLELKVPIIASPMKGITSTEVIIEVGKAGGIGILHKFYSAPMFQEDDIILLEKSGVQYGISIGLDDIYRFGNFRDWLSNYNISIICLDLANGYLEEVKKKVNILAEHIKICGYDCLVMCGNVITWKGAEGLWNAGADIIRLGISTGQLCITGDITGVSMPAISMLENCRNIPAIKVMDGGIRNSGDIVKSLIAGADICMLGSLFGRTFESDHNGRISGMASKAHQIEYYHTTKSIEGITKRIKKDMYVKDLMSELSWGIKSACTYVDSHNIKELKEKGKFIYLD
jgi:IMP dehydrogenase